MPVSLSEKGNQGMQPPSASNGEEEIAYPDATSNVAISRANAKPRGHGGWETGVFLT